MHRTGMCAFITRTEFQCCGSASHRYPACPAKFWRTSLVCRCQLLGRLGWVARPHSVMPIMFASRLIAVVRCVRSVCARVLCMIGGGDVIASNARLLRVPVVPRGAIMMRCGIVMVRTML